MKKRYFAAVTGALIIGAIAARCLDPGWWLAPMLSQAQSLNHLHDKQAVVQAPLAPAARSAAKPAARAAAPTPPTEQPAERTIEVEDLKHDLDVEEVLQSLIHEPAPESVEGMVVNRNIFPTGELKDESWDLPGGEHIQRAFYQSGQVQGLSWALTDGTRLSVKLKPNGDYAGQREEFANGEQVITKYNDQGQIAQRWRITSLGQRFRVL